MQKKILLIGSQPERMTRLRRTFKSLKKLDTNVRILVPYREPKGKPRTLKGIIRYLLLAIQVALSKADIYHFFNVPDITGLPLIWKRGVFVYDVRSPWFSSIKESLGSNALSKVGGMIERIMTIGADIVLTSNYPLAYRAHNWGATNIIVIPNYPPSDFGPSQNREIMRSELDLGDSPTVLYVGKISKIEGSELLKRIILEVSKEDSSVRFLIVGDGPEKQSLDEFFQKHQLTESVKSVGWIPHKEVANYIVASDLCLLPRNLDSFSPFTAPENITKVAEYLAIGRPVVVPRIGGFTNADFPIIAVAPTEMAKAVLDYLKNPIELGTFKRPSWEISHNRLRRIYSKLGAISSQFS